MLDKETRQVISSAHNDNQTIVLVTGVFDVLHSEHQKFLEAAKKEGDVLLVGLESDVRVRQMKGPDRPSNSEEVRVQNLRKWQVADHVFVLPEEFSTRESHEQLIEQIKPSVLAVSSHTKFIEEKKRILNMFGGEVKIVAEHNKDISSTSILESAL